MENWQRRKEKRKVRALAADGWYFLLNVSHWMRSNDCNPYNSYQGDCVKKWPNLSPFICLRLQLSYTFFYPPPPPTVPQSLLSHSNYPSSSSLSWHFALSKPIASHICITDPHTLSSIVVLFYCREVVGCPSSSTLIALREHRPGLLSTCLCFFFSLVLFSHRHLFPFPICCLCFFSGSLICFHFLHSLHLFIPIFISLFLPVSLFCRSPVAPHFTLM